MSRVTELLISELRMVESNIRQQQVHGEAYTGSLVELENYRLELLTALEKL